MTATTHGSRGRCRTVRHREVGEGRSAAKCACPHDHMGVDEPPHEPPAVDSTRGCAAGATGSRFHVREGFAQAEFSAGGSDHAAPKVGIGCPVGRVDLLSIVSHLSFRFLVSSVTLCFPAMSQKFVSALSCFDSGLGSAHAPCFRRSPVM